MKAHIITIDMAVYTLFACTHDSMLSTKGTTFSFPTKADTANTAARKAARGKKAKNLAFT